MYILMEANQNFMQLSVNQIILYPFSDLPLINWNIISIIKHNFTRSKLIERKKVDDQFELVNRVLAGCNIGLCDVSVVNFTNKILTNGFMLGYNETESSNLMFILCVVLIKIILSGPPNDYLHLFRLLDQTVQQSLFWNTNIGIFS